jgi:hypothetical protein
MPIHSSPLQLLHEKEKLIALSRRRIPFVRTTNYKKIHKNVSAKKFEQKNASSIEPTHSGYLSGRHGDTQDA